jgi:aerobic-type carbon monoxide dehydrogenase small subunit (CoxS/CutS family)
MMYNLAVNGRTMELDADGDIPLLWAVRDLIGLTASTSRPAAAGFTCLASAGPVPTPRLPPSPDTS